MPWGSCAEMNWVSKTKVFLLRGLSTDIKSNRLTELKSQHIGRKFSYEMTTTSNKIT